MAVPENPKIYHIVHVDRLASIIAENCLWSDAELVSRSLPGTIIGMSGIKQRRLTELRLASHPQLYVGECVPFYFCPRSVMLYLISQGNHPEMTYRGGQDSIIHLEADLHETVQWAQQNGFRWAFTLSNAGARYFEDRCSLSELGEINWPAVMATKWKECKEGKQAEFLVEKCFPWHLVRRIGTNNLRIESQVNLLLNGVAHRPQIEIKRDWYY